MKKVLILCLFTFQFIAIFANWIEFSDNYQKELFEHLSNGIEQTEVRFSLDGYDIESFDIKGEIFKRISYPNEGEFIEVGKPDLPRFSRLIAIPNQGEATFEIMNMKEEIVSNINVFPRQIYQNESQSDNTEFVIDEQFYKNGDVFPSHIVEFGTPAIMRDYRIVSLTINPFQYNPQTKELRIIKSVDVSVSTSGSEGENLKVRDSKISRFFEPLYESVILNYESIRNRDEEYQQPCYLFIYPNNDDVEEYLQTLVEWKHQKGFEVVAAHTGETGSSLSSIKNYIQDAYDDWENPPEFVCLVGDASGSYNIPTGSSGWGEGDQYYTLLEGNDILADVFIGRLSFNSISGSSSFQTIISKILNYEKEPYLGDTDWYNEALLVGDPSHSETSTISTNKFIKNIMQNHSEDYTFDEVYSSPFVSQMSSSLNAGVSYFNYRGYLGMSGWSNSNTNSLVNGFMLPVVVILTCGTGDFEGTYDCESECFLKAGTVSTPKGAIAAIGTATMSTHTCFNNCVTSGTYYGIFVDEIYNMGGALTRGKLNLYLQYPDNPGSCVNNFSYWNNLMGDPGMEIWTGIPEEMNIEYDNEVALGTNYLEVTVYNSSGFPLENAWVTALMGDDVIFATGFTDIEGRIFLPIEANTTGEVALTVTYHNCIPHLGSFDIIQEDVFVNVFEINIDDDDLGTSSGNGDGLINPGESIELGVSLKNFGLSIANLVSAVITSESECIIITDDTEDYGDIPAGSSVFSDDDFDFSVNTDVLGGTEIILDILIEDEDREQWSDRICLYVDGPYLYADDYSVIDGNNAILEPGETANLEVTLSNIGTVSVYNLSGTLSCSDNRITIEDNEGYFNNVSAGGQASNNTDRYTISAGESIISGSQISFNLQLYNSWGYDQTVSFVMEIGIVSVTDPLGPDAYGYYCYDDEDEFFEDIEYNWIEINQDESYYDFPGEEINLSDPGDTGDIETIELPVNFYFQFYGIQYDEITVCSNGFISPGVTENYEFMNWHVPGPQGPSPMIAAFWDDMVTQYNSNVCYYFHAEEHYFIIEWSHMRNQYNTSYEETFEIILYDPNFYPTTTNDSKILVQYKEVNNVDQGYYRTEHGQYATVGLEDPTCTIGLEYTYDNDYPTAAKPLEDEMAILFTPYPIPAEGPYVYISDYSVNAGGDNIIEYGETVYLSVTLRNIGPDPATNVNMDISLEDEYVTLIDNTESFGTLENDGSCTVNNAYILEVSEIVPDNHYIQLVGNVTSDEETWERYINLIAYAPPDLEINVTSFNIEMEQNEIHHETLELTNTVAGSGALNYTIRVEEPTNRARDLTDSYVECSIGTFEPGESVTWTFTVFNGSDDNEWVTDVNIHFPYGVTVNSASDFVGGSGGDMLYDGSTGENVQVNWHGSTGLGYGYLHANQTAVAEVSADVSSIFSGNIVMNYEIIGDEYGEEPHFVEGTITLHYPLGWISIYPPVGIITGGETDEIDVTFDTGELDPGTHECNIIINDGSDYETVIPVTLNVTSSESDDNIIPLTTKLNGNYPNPFNPAGAGRSPTTTIDFSLKEPCNVQLDIYNIKGEKVVTLIDNLLNAAYHSVTWAGLDQNGKSVSGGVYFYKIKAGKYTSIKKMLLMK